MRSLSIKQYRSQLRLIKVLLDLPNKPFTVREVQRLFQNLNVHCSSHLANIIIKNGINKEVFYIFKPAEKRGQGYLSTYMKTSKGVILTKIISLENESRRTKC